MSQRPTPKPLDVAVAIIVHPDGQFLLGQRPSGKPYAGYWEFPGGKLEAGETVWQALCRELDEELGIQAQVGTPWVTRVFTYPHATVRLHFWRVTAWQGQPHGREGQAFAWASIDPHALNLLAALPQPLLPASLPVLRWLALPDYIVLSNAAEMGIDRFINAFTLAAQAKQLPWLLLREPEFSQRDLMRLYEALLPLCLSYTVRFSVSSRHSSFCAAQHIHYTAQDSVQLPSIEIADALNLAWRGASCHEAADLASLAVKAADYAFLGSVLPTASHPEQIGLGWAKWHEAIQASPVPTYAIGGLSLADVSTAKSAGGQGVAIQRGFWSTYI